MGKDSKFKFENPGAYPYNITMRVYTRKGVYEPVQFDKITERIRSLAEGLSPVVDPVVVAKRTIDAIHDGITTEKLDTISADEAEAMKTIHTDYDKLAARICISNLHKSTPDKFSVMMKALYEDSLVCSETRDTDEDREFDARMGVNVTKRQPYSYVSTEHAAWIAQHADRLDSMIVPARDFNFGYLGYKTLENAYLQKVGGKIYDRPQYMYMRYAVALFMPDLDAVKECYDAVSQHYFTPATPSLLNACMHKQTMLSCFLLGTGDSIEDIMKSCADVSYISKSAGGIGIHMQNIRCAGTKINGTRGLSNGLVRQVRIYDALASCWNQGGKRPGAFSVWLEPEHGDILQFLRMKLQSGADSERARNLFYGCWVPDLFFERLCLGQQWSLFTGVEAERLSQVYDGMGTAAGPPEDAFRSLYERYERTGRAVKSIPAIDVMMLICESQQDNGTPYICWKDSVNRKSNQANVGTIKSSNLCTEIMEYSDKDNYACCTLASINLPKFAVSATGASGDVYSRFDFDKFAEIVCLITRCLNRTIDINYYPVPETKKSNMELRPVAIGVQGMANLLAELDLSFTDDSAKKLDCAIAEALYYWALGESAALARNLGAYSRFEGSPASRGVLQFDMWKEGLELRKKQAAALAAKDPQLEYLRSLPGDFDEIPFSGMFDWPARKAEIMRDGLRNSLLVAYMPTVSTSQILGNTDSFEPFHGNILTRETQAKKQLIVNEYLCKELTAMGLWEKLYASIRDSRGSIQHLDLPARIKEKYRTIWEIPQIEIINRAALRGAFIDQSQSLNIHLRDNSAMMLQGVFAAGWRRDLKTGSYYIRTQAAADPLKNRALQQAPTRDACPIGCDSCSG